MTWTFVTVTYNSAEALKRYWSDGLPEAVEWIVVDNDSKDDSAAVAKSLGATKVISLEKNIGFGAANNVALGMAESEFIACVNPDVKVDFSDLPALERSLSEHGGLVSPQLVNDDGTLQPNGRGRPSLTNKIRGRLLPTASKRYYLYAQSDEMLPVTWLTGAVVMARKETWDALKGWDNLFFVYYEDSDLSLRARQAGFGVHVDGSVRWIHGWGRDTKAFSWTPWKLELDSASKFYRRYPWLVL
jgi:N-acetylglucosaminyl-diphospho-decaprenol L-rhamnosyltransferase